MMKNNNQLIPYIAKLDLHELSKEERQTLAVNIAKKINLSQLEKNIRKVTLKLTEVGEPRYGALKDDVIIEDTQRLQLVYALNYNFEIFQGWVKNIRKNKMNCIENDEGIFPYLIYTQEMINTIIKYGEFKENQIKETKLLGGGNNAPLAL